MSSSLISHGAQDPLVILDAWGQKNNIVVGWHVESHPGSATFKATLFFSFYLIKSTRSGDFVKGVLTPRSNGEGTKIKTAKRDAAIAFLNSNKRKTCEKQKKEQEKKQNAVKKGKNRRERKREARLQRNKETRHQKQKDTVNNKESESGKGASQSESCESPAEKVERVLDRSRSVGEKRARDWSERRGSERSRSCYGSDEEREKRGWGDEKERGRKLSR